MLVPEECKRTRSIHIEDSFIHALEDACNWKKAERLPDDSFCQLYIGTDVLRSMQSSDNQIIWGRRGTGKTHLLKAFTQQINSDPECKRLAYYISCDEISMESPLDIQFGSDLEKMKYYARESFKGFVLNILDQITDTYKSLISSKYFFNESKGTLEQEEIYKAADDILLQLYQACWYGSSKVNNIQKSEVKTDRSGQEKETNLAINSEIKLSTPFSFGSVVNLLLGRSRKKSTKQEIQQEITITHRYFFNFSDIRHLFLKFATELGLETIYICIDELWLIDKKREMSLQPLFLDYLRQAFLNCSGISVKIASIREVTKLNNKNSAFNNYGVQSGHDIFELTNLDTQFDGEKARINFYKEFLCARINYFIYRNSNTNDEYSKENIVTMIFKSEHNLASLIRYTHTIPRNFLIVLQRALTVINFDLSHRFLHKYLAEEVVIRTYLEDKRSNLPMNEGSLYDAISTYINKTQHYFFMLSTKQFKRLKAEIDNLVYLEIIHQIPSSILPQNLMDKYKGFYVDCGKYMHTLRTKRIPIDTENGYDFSYVLPESVIQNYKDYIVDLDNIDSKFLECPNCGNQISKCHPVYLKAQLCPICAFHLK